MNSYEEVAKEMSLESNRAALFIVYMRTRWADEETIHCKVGYAKEWAERFKRGIEYGASDYIGQSLLRELRPGKYNAE